MNEKKSKLPLRELTREPVQLQMDQETPWVRELLQKAAPGPELGVDDPKQWAQEAQFSADMMVQKLDAGEDVLLQGSFKAQVPAQCGRCGDSFKAERQGDFRLFLHPTHSLDLDQGTDAFDDVEYREISAQHIDLVDIMAEQLVLAEPMVDCPNRKADGTCTLCGKNPQYSQEDPSTLLAKKDGQGDQKKADSPFAVLAKYKRS